MSLYVFCDLIFAFIFLFKDMDCETGRFCGKVVEELLINFYP